MSESRFTIDGRTFTWTTEDDEKVTVPLRVPMDLVLEFAEVAMGDAERFSFLSQVAPDAEPTLRKMDRNDFNAMYSAWLLAYYDGAKPGESSASQS